MKFKNYLLIPITILIAGAVFYLFGRAKAVTAEVTEELPVEKVWTRMDSLIHTYEHLISQQIDSAGTVGAAIVVVHKGEIGLLKCFGVKEIDSNDFIDQHTIFRLASVSKTLTGTLAFMLSDENLIPLNSRIIDYLPGFRLKDSINTHELRIDHILSHTSGLVSHAYDNLVEAGVDFGTIMDSLHRVNISAPPGRIYSYQNVAFSLYDTVASLATGKSFDSLMEEKIFSPFGMNDASVGLLSFLESDNKAAPHIGIGLNSRSLGINNRYYNTNPAAGVNASISDMAGFISAMLGHKPETLDSAGIRAILSPKVITPLRWNYLNKWKSVESKHYALGWRIIGSYGKQIAYHGGYVNGYRAEIALCPEEDFGLAFLSNSPNAAGSISIPLFLDLYFEGKDGFDGLDDLK
ncbi:MAG: beta-lactamase family protein [Bacteroidales bacterium]|nr:beta-lactamase family protein [Bacteroidales bacterium]